METKQRVGRASAAMVALAALALAGCDKPSGTTDSGKGPAIQIDGSSTVAPIMNAATEMFKQENEDVSPPRVGVSGTGGGFKKFLDKQPNLRTDISNASRPISESEKKLATEVGVEYIEIPIAYDGMAVVVHPKNTWCDHLTVDELKKIWSPDSRIENWKDVRAGFPDKPLRLFGPGTDSGTYDYFAEAVVGGKKTRSDYNASENDNTLVKGVSGDEGGLGYFGFAYYEANRESLKLLAIDGGTGKPVTPDLDKIRSNEYSPLSRPLFIYVNATSAARPDVQKFVRFLLGNAKSIVEHPKVGYVGLSPALYTMGLKRFDERIAGSVYTDAASVHHPLAEMYGLREVETP